MQIGRDSKIDNPVNVESGLLECAIYWLGVAIFTKDLNGRYIFANQAFLDILGRSSNEVIGFAAHDIFDSAVAAQIKEHDSIVLTTGQTITQKEYYAPNDGVETHSYISVKKPVYDQSGIATGIVGVIVDVAQNVKVDFVISESRKILDLALSNIDGHFYIKDRNHRYVYVSPSVCRQLRRPPDQIVGRTDKELLSEEEARRVTEFDEKVFSTGQRQAGEEVLVGKDGQPRYFWSIKQVMQRSEQIDCLVGISIDITELKLAQQAALASEIRFRKLFEVSQDAVLLANKELHFIDCNQATVELLGLRSKSEVLGKTPSDISPPLQDCGVSSPDLVKSHIDIIKKSGHHRFNWLIVSRRRDEILQVEVHASLVELDGEPVFLATMRDRTEQMKNEFTIHKLAYYDTLTEIPNRRLFFDRLSKALALSQRTNQFGAVVYLDLDNFKPINDQYGHSAGDLLLKEVAHRLSELIREQDTVARLGGDEFVVLLVNVASTVDAAWVQAKRVAERIRDRLSKKYYLLVKNAEEINETIELMCSASLGLTLFPPFGERGEEIIRRADNAMYRAKGSGRNQIYIDNNIAPIANQAGGGVVKK